MLNLGFLLKRACVQPILLVRFITGLTVHPLAAATTITKMQSWQIQSYGDVKLLQLAESPIPVVAESNQLLVKVNATALNPIDLQMLGGYGRSLFSLLRWYKTEFPLVLGREFSGTVVDKGRCVSDSEFKIGDSVYGIVPIEKQGCQREYLLADKAQVLVRPEHLNATEAASILYVSITAWSALYISGGLATVAEPSKLKVLVLGASGGVGTAAVQMLKSQNVHVVGVCSTDAFPLVTSLGAEHVYDYKNPGYAAQVASHNPYDIILDCAKYGPEKLPSEWQYKAFVTLNSPLATNTDRLGLIGGLFYSAGQLVASNVPRVFSGQSVRWGFFSPQPSAFEFIGKLIGNKQLKPIVQKIFKFEQVPEAFKMVEAGHLRGKIVIEL